VAETTSDFLVDKLRDWSVNVIFGFLGDGNNAIMEALRTRQNKVRFIQVRHEEAAAFMACAYANFTGRLGARLATSGPISSLALSAPWPIRITALRPALRTSAALGRL